MPPQYPQSHSAGQSSSHFVDIILLISAINSDVFVLLAVKETPVLTRVTAATVNDVVRKHQEKEIEK